MKKTFNISFFVLAGFCLFRVGVVCASQGYLEGSDGARLFYEEHTAEKKLGAAILLHGWKTSSKEWSRLEPLLYQNGWSTVAMDMRGHGASTDRDGRAIKLDVMSPEDRKNILLDVDALKPLVENNGKVWIVGSSFGSAVAFKYTLDHPWVTGLVLISPAFHYSGEAYKEDMKKYGARPILFVASKEDKVSYETAKKLNSEARGKSKLLKVRGSAHGIASILRSDPKIQLEILNWLNKNS